jgi:hypothetical protein
VRSLLYVLYSKYTFIAKCSPACSSNLVTFDSSRLECDIVWRVVIVASKECRIACNVKTSGVQKLFLLDYLTLKNKLITMLRNVESYPKTRVIESFNPHCSERFCCTSNRDKKHMQNLSGVSCNVFVRESYSWKFNTVKLRFGHLRSLCK